jgi:uncharacterized metal-binding protein
MEDLMVEERNLITPSCASCEVEVNKRSCYADTRAGSKGCPTLTSKEILQEAKREYEIPEIKEFARQASIQEAECYANRHQRPYIRQPTKTRIQEICEFSKKMGYSRLGLAFCSGLVSEARTVERIIRAHGFTVVSVVCKAGRALKEEIGIKDEEKVFQGKRESMCNPIYQAKILNYGKTEFNIALGLCVGHDSLFFEYAEAPTTVLAVKDRVTGHNPLAAVYLSDFYYKKIEHNEL